MKKQHRILDFGCATGALLLEFIRGGYVNVCGTDVSFWAVNYGRETYGLTNYQIQYYNPNLLEAGADWIIALDVFEHIGNEELQNILRLIQCGRLVMRVPVSAEEGGPFVLEVSRNDKTHIQCHTKEWWLERFGPYAKSHEFIATPSIYDSDGVLAVIFQWRQEQ
jgi:cyclopropane fatty-acyl-phospholipid synthase-like methyltransferase